jgi:hypothetical protein
MKWGGAYFWAAVLRGPDRFRTGVRGVADRSLASRAQDHLGVAPLPGLEPGLRNPKFRVLPDYTKEDCAAEDSGSKLLLLQELLAERPFD